MQFGTSFSIKYARDMGVDPRACLNAALSDLGVKRLRLMSYWDLHEPTFENYDFSDLDWQIEIAEQYGSEVTLCLGLRQPRWPENHWASWAKKLPADEWEKALDNYIATVVNRYKSHKCIVSYQLENEALLKNFGNDGDYDRKRLKREFKSVKQLDPTRPIIMSTSDSWGLPILSPRPDMYGFSIYRYFYDKGQYRHSRRPAWFYAKRALLIRIFKWRKTFIHELQAEPWGPRQTYDMPVDEQFKSMNRERVQEAVQFAHKSHLLPADLWGLEWWYWLKITQNRPEIWDDLKLVFSEL